jgi:hypothetical protein
MTLILLFKILVVLFFLIMFLRRPSWTWGVGLLTVSTAVLLDTILGTFDPEQIIAQLGFFFYVLSGSIGAGAAFWLLSLLRPYLPLQLVSETKDIPALSPPSTAHHNNQPPALTPATDESGAAFDRQLIYEEIHHRFGREDVFDLMFDLDIHENDVMSVSANMPQLIINIMEWTAQNGQTGALALAVERILTPPDPATLPRLEKISADSPPTILRHYLLAHYNLETLQTLSAHLNIDWEQLNAGNKKTKVRDLLQHLYRRNRIDELIEWIQKTDESSADVEKAA